MARPPRRQPAPVQSPSQSTVVALREADAGKQAGSAAASHDGLDQVTESLAQELATALEDGGGLTWEDRAALQQQVELALREQAGPTGADAQGRPEWLETIEGLRQNGILTDEDANALVRQLDAILSPSRNKDVSLALEFGRRFAQDGQDQALAWFKAQLAAGDATSTSAGAKPSEPPATLASAIVNSKSRRLRGPPRR